MMEITTLVRPSPLFCPPKAVTKQFIADAFPSSPPSFRPDAEVALAECVTLALQEAIARAHARAVATRGPQSRLRAEDVEAIAADIMLDFT